MNEKIKFYYYDSETLRPTISRELDWPVDRLDPPHSLRVAPPEAGENQVVLAREDRSGWELVWDYTGTVYCNTIDGSEVTLKLGEKPGPYLKILKEDTCKIS